jgi:hypothetical protein
MRVDVKSGRDFRDHGDLEGVVSRNRLQRNVRLRLKDTRRHGTRVILSECARGKGSNRERCEAR